MTASHDPKHRRFWFARFFILLALPFALVVGERAIIWAAAQFKVWNDGELLTASDLNANFATLQGQIDALVPAGTIIGYSGAGVAVDGGAPTFPAGWLLCDGQTVSRTTYATLFNAIGITYGGGDGIRTFTLPDFRGRTLIGAGQGSGLTVRRLGDKLGEETHTLTIAEMPSHTHPYNDPLIGDFPGLTHDTNGTTVEYAHVNEGTTASAGGGQPHNLMPPSAVVNYLIKY
jgi:microcystin-dependent protein